MRRSSISKSHATRDRLVAAQLRFEQLEKREMLAGLVMEDSVFDAEQFADNIEEQVPVDTTGLNGVVGYTYAVIDGNPNKPIGGSGGAAVMPWDNPNDNSEIAADPTLPQEIASPSKLITAASIMHLLQEQNPGLNYNDLQTALQTELNQPIVNYLPATWAAQGYDSNFDDITLTELLTHTSGLRSDNNPTGGGPGVWVTTSTLPGGAFSDGGNIYNYSGLQQISEFGSVDTSKPSDYWTNNYAWFRVMLPYMWDAVDNAALDANAVSSQLPTDPKSTPFSPMIAKDTELAGELVQAMISDWGTEVEPDSDGIMSITPDRVVASIYKYYVSTFLLKPSGVEDPRTKPLETTPTLLYPLDPTIVPGTEIWPSVPGGGPTAAQVPGFNTGDRTAEAGPRGWVMAAFDLARTFWGVRNGVDGSPLLEDATLDMMDAQGLGWQHSTNTGYVGDWGQYWGHNGVNFRPAAPTAITIPSPNVPNNARLAQMNNTVAIAFDNGVAASLLFNSQIRSEDQAIRTPIVIGAAFNPTATPTGVGTTATLIAAYDNAWTELVYEGDETNDVFTIQTNPVNADYIDIVVSPTTTITRRIDTLDVLTIRGLGGADTFNVVDLPDGIQLNLEGGGGDDEFYIDSVENGSLVTLHGDAGDDTFYASDSPQFLETVNQVTFHGGANIDTVELNDRINNNPHDHAHTYFLGVDQLHRQGGGPQSVFDVDLFFSSVEVSNLATSLAPFDDFVEVLSTGVSTVISTGQGNDSVEVAGASNNLDDVKGLTLNLGSGVDTVTMYDQNNPWTNAASHAYDVSATEVQRLAGNPANPVTIQMNDIEMLDLFASDFSDEVWIANMPELAGTIHLGEGDDTAVTTSGNLEDVDDLVILGGKGEDTVLLDDAMNPYGVPEDGSFPVGIPTANTYNVSTTRVRRDGSGIPPDIQVASDINVDYEDVEHLSLSSAERGDVVYISGGGAWTTDLILGEGDDEVYASLFEQNIEFVDGLTVYGNQGDDELYLHDAHNPYSHVLSNQYEVASDHVSRYRDVNGPGQTHMPPGTDPADAVDVLVQMVSVELLDLTTGDESDEVQVLSSTDGGTTIDTRIGDDTIETVSGDLAAVDGLFVESNVGEDTLVLDDSRNPYRGQFAENYELATGQVLRGVGDGTVIGGAMPITVEYANLEHLKLVSGSRGDQIDVIRGGTLTTEVRTGDGDDEVVVTPDEGNLQLVASLTVDGEADHDLVVLHDANNPYINNLGHLYTIDELQVHRDGGVFGQPLVIVPVVVAYANIEELELDTGSEAEIFNFGGTGSDASVTVRGNDGSDRFNVTDDVFGELSVFGGNPTRAPGDVFHLEAPAGVLTGLLPETAHSGQAIIGDMQISYGEIENLDSNFPTPSPENDDFGDFDGNGIVDGDDLTHPLFGFYARFGNGLSGLDLLAWQQNLGQEVPGNLVAAMGAQVASGPFPVHLIATKGSSESEKEAVQRPEDLVFLRWTQAPRDDVASTNTNLGRPLFRPIARSTSGDRVDVTSLEEAYDSVFSSFELE